jgi:hypothetical protein
MCGTLKIIIVNEEENLTCHAQCVKQVSLRPKLAARKAFMEAQVRV